MNTLLQASGGGACCGSDGVVVVVVLLLLLAVPGLFVQAFVVELFVVVHLCRRSNGCESVLRY